MDDRQQAFLAALAKNPDDEVTRLVYADYLDDVDQPEEADRMRKWKAAKDWLGAFAATRGLRICDSSYYDEDSASEAVDAASLLGVFTRYAEGGEWGEHTYDNTESYKGFPNDEWKRAWECWSVVTGKAIPENAKNNYGGEEYYDVPFTCSC